MELRIQRRVLNQLQSMFKDGLEGTQSLSLFKKRVLNFLGKALTLTQDPSKSLEELNSTVDTIVSTASQVWEQPISEIVVNKRHSKAVALTKKSVIVIALEEGIPREVLRDKLKMHLSTIYFHKSTHQGEMLYNKYYKLKFNQVLDNYRTRNENITSKQTNENPKSESP